YFTIDANGNLKLISVLDYEDVWHSKYYSVVVVANPTNGSDAISQLFILSIDNVVEPMMFVNPVKGTLISENNAVGVAVANFMATNVNGVAPTYSLGGTDSAYFTINSIGMLGCKSVLDFEDVWHTAKNYSVVVTATLPNGSAAISKLFVLTLANVNEKMSFVATTAGSAISENNAVGVVVGNFLATEVNKLAVTYSLAGTDLTYFTIDTNGNLKLKSSLDFEDAGHANNYSVVVVAKSDQSTAVSKLFVLSLGNVAEVTNFVAATRGGAISENNTVGVAVANFLANNANGAMVTYSLGGVDSAYFTINANGNLKLASVLDYEDSQHPARNYSVVITANPTDASGAISQLFILSLGDVGEAMAFVNTTAGNAINENNATGVSVANFLAINGAGATVTYSLGGIDANYFTIEANGNLKLISVLDFEDTWHTAKNYSVVVTATAGGGNVAISKLFVLSLGNVNEPMSFTTTIAGIAMSENNTVGVVVANCLATEATAATVTYSLGGTDADYFTIDATGKLKLISILDYEDLWRIPPDPFINWPPPINGTYKPNYSVVITATSDQGGLISRLFVVSLGDVPEPTSFVEMTTGVTISENNAVDLAVGNFLATNVNGAMVTYSIGGVDSGYFTIDANGNLKLTAILDYEDGLRHIPNKNNPAFLHWDRNHKYSVVVTASATDASGAVSKLFVLKIDDVAEPISMGFGGSYWIQPMPESSAIGTQIVGVSAVDNSPGTVPGAVYNTYIRLDNMEADYKYFTLVYDRNQRGNSLNGNIVLASMLDFEDAQHPSPYYTILARASSQKGNSVSQLFIFTLGDVAEPMGFAAPAGGGVISENNVVGVTVANFLATDVSGSAMVYSLSGDDAKYFFLDANGNLRLTGAILDYEDMWRPHPMYYNREYTRWDPIYDAYNPNYSVVVTA
ncbi:MAG: hypothetical protein ORN28_06990, partial [Rhodoferax sp.]|nr:hypothetical protein [Rhodoferax sp.]